MKGSKAVLELLSREGVDVMFGYPGGSVMPIYDDLLDSDIRHILARHEQGAAHMADGYARALGRPGVCISTSGPGATNLITGVATAFVDSSPMIVLTGQVTTNSIGMDAFQEADSFSLMMPVTKHNFRLLDVNDLPEAVKRGMAIATSGRMGPVHIDIPSDIMRADIDESEFDREFPAPLVKEDLSHVPDAVRIIAAAERPVILAGGGCIVSGASAEVARLSETIMAPVVTSLMGKSVFPEDHPLAMGVLGMHGRMVARKAIMDADVIIAVGTRFSDRTFGSPNDVSQNTKVVHIDIDPTEVGKHPRTHARVLADAKHGLTEILRLLPATGAETPWSLRMKALNRECSCDLEYDETPILPQRVLHELEKAMPEGTIITTEVGQNQMWAMHHLRIKEPRQFISSGGFGTMGFGFPAAIGAKVARPDRKVVDIAGDGSFLMVCQELATAVAEDIPVIVCILDNGWLGMVKQWQKLFNDERYSGTELRSNPDFVKLAESFGARGLRVTRPSELADAFETAFESDVPFVIDVVVDPEEDILPMVPPNPDLPVIRGRCQWKHGWN